MQVPDFDRFCRLKDGSLDLAKVREWEQAIKSARKQAADLVRVYATDLVYCSVCAAKHLSREDVEIIVNAIHPCGTAAGWKISDEPFSEGDPNPMECNSNANKLHWLLVC